MKKAQGEKSSKRLISKDEAIQLLFHSESIESYNESRCFDEYGNYFFPTDYVATSPNTAYGSSDGYELSELIQISGE